MKTYKPQKSTESFLSQKLLIANRPSYKKTAQK